MKNLNMDTFIGLLQDTHAEEWEATPLTQEAIAWLNELLAFLFPNNLLPKKAAYEGILKKSQVNLENILWSYLDAKEIAIPNTVALFYDSLQNIYQNLR